MIKMPSENNPEIICHLERKLPFTAFDSRWVPSSARFVSVGCDLSNKGYLGIYELSQGAVQVVHEVCKPISLRCATFGASTLEERHLATGDFCGHLQIWDLENLASPVSAVSAHREIINCVTGVGLKGGASPLIATGSRDGFVSLWDPRQPEKAVASIGPEEGTARQDCWSVAFGSQTTAEQRVVASGYDNGDLKLFDLRKMELLWETNLKHGISCLEFDAKDPLGDRLVATTSNSKICVCHVSPSDKSSRAVESGHRSTVWCATHLPQNPAIFMTSGGDGNLNLWQHNNDDNYSARSHKLELLASAGVSKEAISRFSWHPDKTGLGLATSFDQMLRIVIVTRLSTAARTS